MLVNTNDITKFTELKGKFLEWYGIDNPEERAMEIGLLRGDILLPVTTETFARLYKEKILTPDADDGTIISPDELAFCERLKIIGFANRADVERALDELDNEEGKN